MSALSSVVRIQLYAALLITRKDAQLLLKLMMEDRFPRIWVPSSENRDVRQLLWHLHRLVQMRTRIMNQLPGAGDERGPALENQSCQKARKRPEPSGNPNLPGLAAGAMVSNSCACPFEIYIYLRQFNLWEGKACSLANP